MTSLIDTPAGTLFDFEPQTVSALVRPTDPHQLTVFDCIAEAEAEQAKPAEPCVTCARYGMFSCRETVGTCDLCGGYGDVNMDYSKSGDRERPDETVCLDCLMGGAHIKAAHEAAEQDAAAMIHDAFEAIWTSPANDGTGFGEADLTASLAEHEQMLEDLNAKRITPARVIGSGYKKPLTLAREWLWKQIHEGRRDLATRGRTNAVNIGNVLYRLPAGHPAKDHRVRVTMDEKYGHLVKLSCTCDVRGECGYSAPTSYTADKIEAHMAGKRDLR